MDTEEDPSESPHLDAETATQCLTALLCKKLRVHVSDGRMFVGDFKCVDPESNIVLTDTQEYDPRPADSEPLAQLQVTGPLGIGKFRGMVVVPGRYIMRIEREDWFWKLSTTEQLGLESQMAQMQLEAPEMLSSLADSRNYVALQEQDEPDYDDEGSSFA